ncbi:unnamed protein product [Closterium sp. Naga37s-1]|nr:unnamed protein product [Closterium sp. Naga37s-1]
MITANRKKRVNTFTAKLIGANEVPKGNSAAARNAVNDKSGTGQMKLEFYKKDDKLVWVKFAVKASKLEGEMPPTKTHIHKGDKGQNRPVLLELPCKYEKKSNNDWRCEGVIGQEKALSHSQVSDLMKIAHQPSGFYGNIHTKKYPDGAVRGQFSRK